MFNSQSVSISISVRQRRERAPKRPMGGARPLVAMALSVLVVAGSGCAIRVNGIVRDARNNAPIGGAVVSANDGRNRMRVTDPAGQFSIKTDSDTPSLVVNAPGYTAATVTIPPGEDIRVIAVSLQPLSGARPPATAAAANP